MREWKGAARVLGLYLLTITDSARMWRGPNLEEKEHHALRSSKESCTGSGDAIPKGCKLLLDMWAVKGGIHLVGTTIGPRGSRVVLALWLQFSVRGINASRSSQRPKCKSRVTGKGLEERLSTPSAQFELPEKDLIFLEKVERSLYYIQLSLKQISIAPRSVTAAQSICWNVQASLITAVSGAVYHSYRTTASLEAVGMIWSSSFPFCLLGYCCGQAASIYWKRVS